MNALLDATLEHLRALVAFDTRNPPRAIGTGGIFDYLRAQLPGFDVTVTDYGAGAVIGHRYVEAGQLRAQVVEDAAGADGARRVARVEGDQRAQVLQRGIQQGVHRALRQAAALIPSRSGSLPPTASSSCRTA